MAIWLRVLLAVLMWVGGSGVAHAQAPALDLHGMIPAAPGTAWQGPLLTWSPQDGSARSSYAVLLELASDTAVRFVDAGTLDSDPGYPLAQFAAVNVAGQVALSRRVSVGGAMPLFLGTQSNGPVLGTITRGPALGDLVVHGAFAVKPAPVDQGWGASVIPYVRVPTGAQRQSLGDRSVGGGMIVAAGAGLPWLRVDGNVGIEHRSRVLDTVQVFGGWSVPVAGAVGVRVSDMLWVGGEVRGAVHLERQPAVVPDWVGTSPVEWFATLRVRPPGPVAVHGAIGRGLTDGPGTANARIFVGVTGVVGGEEPGTWSVAVTDPLGQPVRDAEVHIGGEALATTGPHGAATLVGSRWRRGAQVRAQGFIDAPVPEPSSDEPVEVQLSWAPAQIAVRISDEEGAQVPARVVLTGEAGASESLQAVPGRYDVRVEAPGLGTQERTLVVRPGHAITAPFEVVMRSAEGADQIGVIIVDPDGQPVRDARVLVDGRPVGTTADGGLVRVAGLPPGPHSVEVQHPDYTAAVIEDVPTNQGDTTIQLRREKGSVRVTVRDPEGAAVDDAVVRFLGPRRLPPIPLGEGGQRVQVLGPGTWTVLVTSQTYGVQERTVDVPDDGWALIEVRMVLQPAEEGEAILTLQVVDPDGIPVDGADVALDGRELGQTSTGGSLRIQGLAPGVRTLTLARARMRPVQPLPIVLSAGDQERVVQMDWLPGQVDVRAHTQEGPVVDGVVRFFGPSTIPPTSLGAEGQAAFTLDAGAWNLLVTSEAYGVQQRRLEIPADSRSRYVVEFELVPVEGGTAELTVQVLDPTGQAVDRATVALDGIDVGATSNSGEIVLTELSPGARSVQVRAPVLSAPAHPVELAEDPVTEVVRMGWASGAVQVAVHDADGPVPDAILRFLGPAGPRPLPVDAAGLALTQLTPGAWVALATSESAGVGEIRFEVPAAPGLTEVALAVSRAAPGTAALALRVVDPSDQPVPDARVQVGEQVLATGDGGQLVVRDLTPGPMAVKLGAPGFVEAGPLALELGPGTHEHKVVLAWESVQVSVRTELADGSPVAARVQPEGGPADAVAVQTTEAGEGTLALVPGDWRVLGTAEARVAEAQLQVAVGEGTAELTLVLREAGARLQGRQVTIGEQVPFDFDSAVLRADSGPVLDAVARVIRSAPGIVRIEVQGHTDNIGTVAVNQRLSQRRAESVVRALIERGVAPEKLVPVGHGRGRPRASNDTVEGRAANRRVQFEVREVSEGNEVP